MAVARLPQSDHSPLLRTDFTDDAAWQALVDEVGGDWVTVMADPGHDGLSVAELTELVPEGARYPVLAVADGVTFSSDSPLSGSLSLVDLREEPGRTFRAVPDAFRSAIANLAIQNEGFGDFLPKLDEAGVYRLSDRHLQALAELRATMRPNTGTPVAGRTIPGPPAQPGRAGQAGRAAMAKRPGVPPKY